MEFDSLRREYTQTGLTEGDLPDDPIDLFENWFQQAADAGIDLPDAMTLATTTRDGVPSARMVLMRGFDRNGFVFYTNYGSRKGQELAGNPQAVLVFHWSIHDRQVRISGEVEKVSREQSRTYFQSRPRGSQLAALASRQSEVIANRETLQAEFDRLAAMYRDQEIPLPSDWGGYQLAPEQVEFWQGRPNRLHDRFLYTRQSDGTWRIRRLAP